MSPAFVCDVCATPESPDVFGVPLCAECVGDPSRAEGYRVTIEHEDWRSEGGVDAWIPGAACGPELQEY